MAFLKKIFIFLIVLAVIVGVGGFLLPRELVVERVISINAAPEKIFPYVNDLRKMQEWQPWAKIDPEGTTYKYEGAAQGIGQKVVWSSENKEVGKGSQEIVGSVEHSSVKTALDFNEHGKAEAVFKLQPSASGTKVTWGFKSDMGDNPLGRWMGLMIGPMVGSQYEAGLDNMKTLVEALPDDPPPASATP